MTAPEHGLTLADALVEARGLAERGADAASAADVLERVVNAAAATPSVLEALRNVPAGRALLRFIDGEQAFEFGAGEGALRIARADRRGPGPKVDATAATWLGLMAGTLKPWLAFTRGLVVCRAGLNELRWMQQVAERMQQGYQQASVDGGAS
jgi:hypothetical protein